VPALSLTPRPAWQFDATLGRQKLLAQLQAASLAAWEAEGLAAGACRRQRPAGLCRAHAGTCTLAHATQLQVARPETLINLPATTRRNLELTHTLRGDTAPTLFSLLDTAQTGMGSRCLKHWLLNPERDRTTATLRLATLAWLRDWGNGQGLVSMRQALRALRRCRTHRRPHRVAPGPPPRAGGADADTAQCTSNIRAAHAYR
jgi:DNA mismatch repair protein MutS